MRMNVPGHSDLRRIVVLNPKGGCGKTTLAVNLAGYLACQDKPVALVDYDPQGSSTQWLHRRPPTLPTIDRLADHGLARTGLADQSDRAAVWHAEGHVAHRLEPAFRQREGDLQIPYLQQVLHSGPFPQTSVA